LQKQRDEAAILRHKQFIDHAIEDIHYKEEKREEYLKEELKASTIMINQAKKLLQLDEEKKQQQRAFMKHYQDTIYQENLDNIERKQRHKLGSFAEDK
jgi:hypothetical protein